MSLKRFLIRNYNEITPFLSNDKGDIIEKIASLMVIWWNFKEGFNVKDIILIYFWEKNNAWIKACSNI